MENKENMTVLKHFNPMKLREKYSANSPKTSNSSFWMGDNFGRRTSIFDSWGVEEEVKKPSVDTIALASYRRSIANFVNIVTGRNDIKVNFKSGDDSYTDGKKVVISSNIKERNFDSTVGLALHEGSHILLSDFEFLRNLAGGFVTDNETILKGEKKGYSKREVLVHLKNLLNYVEDRRIDYHIFKNSPGYKGYYHSMYKTYFHSNIIDKALKSDEYTSNDWNSYLFRIINLTNENRNLKAINDLDKIYKLLFVDNHPSTIKDTKSAFKIAVGIYHIILDNLKDGIEETNEDTGEVTTKPASESNSEENSESESGGGKSESKELSDEEFEGLKKAVEDGDIGSGGSSEGSEIVLSEAQKKSLEKAFDKQKDFVNGKTKKSKLAKKWASEINAVEESGMRLTDVGGKELGEYDWRTDSQGNGMSKCVVIDKITDGLLENDLCEVLRKNYYSSEDREKVVVEGLRLGTMLGKKLKVRNESRDTKWTRKDSGRIDKRLIAELGFGNERVFSTTFTDSYADAHLHISIDASGSMGGDKWDNTIKATVAICKAASMIQGLSVEVSVRYTTYNRGSRRNDEMPAILMAYDSRKNKMAHIKKYFKYMRVCGTTPEGLCYQAIMDKISSGSNDKESYFLNFSDGMPMFSNATIRYYSTQAVKHTKKMMKEIRNKGVSVLSYYIGGDYERSSNSEDFISMYGSDAKFIDVTSVGAVAKTMNKKFLAK